MATWQIQKAKAHFSELIEAADKKGPQIITRHGAERAVVLSAADYRTLSLQKPDFKEFLLGGPKTDNFEIKRDRDTGRKIVL